MKLRRFLSMMGVVALIALIYSPSTIGFSASPSGDGGTGPTDTSQSGTSMFLSYLRANGYHVLVANTSQQVMTALSGQKKVAYFLIGADTVIGENVVQALKSGFQAGRVSTLVAEGNATNIVLLQAFGAHVNGVPIVDPTSSFQDKRVFDVHLQLGTNQATGVIDIASPLVLNSSSPLAPVATTSKISYDLENLNVGPRTVIAAGSSAAGARALVLTDSAPFTNFLFNYSQPQEGVSEQRFVSTMAGWVVPAKNTTVILDSSNYLPAQPPKFQIGLPIGPLVTYAIEQDLGSMNTYYASFPSQISSYLAGQGVQVSDGVASGIVALMLLTTVYGAVTRWFAPEKKGRDDLAPPNVERTIVAESAARLDFLQTSRSKGGYVATLAQLYELLGSVVNSEFKKGILSIEESDLAAKVGADEAMRAKKLFVSLAKIHDFATGRKRFLFPPVFRWRALTARTTRDAEAFLNLLGITIAGEAETEKKKVENLMRERMTSR